MLEGLICKLEEEMCELTVVKAVKCIGKQTGTNGKNAWVLDQDLAIDDKGNVITDLKEYGLVWISHLIEGNGIDIAKKEYKSDVTLPLNIEGFNNMCKFLRGMEDEQSSNFLSMFFVMSMSAIMANYEEVQLNQPLLDIHSVK